MKASIYYKYIIESIVKQEKKTMINIDQIRSKKLSWIVVEISVEVVDSLKVVVHGNSSIHLLPL